MSYEKFGALAGVSAQAVQKWMAGGNVKDATLKALVSKEPFRRRGVTVEWIRYGEAAGQVDPRKLSMLAIDVAHAWMQLTPERQEWVRDLVFTMHFMEGHFPSMKRPRPKAEHYAGFENALEREMSDSTL